MDHPIHPALESVKKATSIRSVWGYGDSTTRSYEDDDQRHNYRLSQQLTSHQENKASTYLPEPEPHPTQTPPPSIPFQPTGNKPHDYHKILPNETVPHPSAKSITTTIHDFRFALFPRQDPSTHVMSCPALPCPLKSEPLTRMAVGIFPFIGSNSIPIF